MEDIPDIVPQIPTENVYVKALINGLGATIILWSFWTPFIIFLARPLVNAQIKEFTCSILSDIGSGDRYTYNSFLYQYLTALVASGQLTTNQMYQILKNSSVSQRDNTVADNIVNQPPETNFNQNLLIIILFVVTYFLVMICCVLGIYTLSSWFSINLGPLYTFNAVMALIIIAIEATFFGAVAMRFIPFDINLIIEQLQFKLDSYLSDLGSKQFVRPACAFGPPLQDYYIGYWLASPGSYLYFGSLDEAQQRCLLNYECVAVTTTGDGSYYLTSERTKYRDCNGCGYHNAGSTSWLLNDCR
jgi:hypothetical protein